ncbi:Hypothetical protein PMT9312_1904 [Prochlorococcus marinus str. MIT 9312]|uniref:Uncharacterized protein n=1 Tax=Prochlorococcus marinus (strain MIT 9312) TaxID=74546 RepID=A7FAK4_PROM9|nr:hypothetical protein [Prochlorococcus marinus]ABS83178.1 Hypothetical protein PMT9312_1904 [Prochlorococcus marinus str. MIT 9312]KGG01596.1 hypothetical protein EU97_0303 [Prochlorococcus marinus str. MIT 9311]
MKRLLLPLLAALALPTTVEANWFGKYGSSREAYFACRDWQSNKKSLSCKYDKETNQVLGLKDYFKVKKRFKY